MQISEVYHMSTWKAILFDRDETISYDDPQRLAMLGNYIDDILDKPGYFNSLSIDDWREVLLEALNEHNLGYFDINTVEKEIFMWRAFFRRLLVREGYKGDVEAKAEYAHSIYNILEIIRPFPESEHVFKTLKKNGYRIGIVSNCFPTLKLSLKIINLDTYIDACINSSSVGSRKPDPGIYNMALQQLNLEPREAIFIDNTEENVVAAQKLGMTAFHINRDLPKSDFGEYKLHNLTGILEFLSLDPALVPGT
jgi:putative hydrolase of the HAD superfamily